MDFVHLQIEVYFKQKIFNKIKFVNELNAYFDNVFRFTDDASELNDERLSQLDTIEICHGVIEYLTISNKKLIVRIIAATDGSKVDEIPSRYQSAILKYLNYITPTQRNIQALKIEVAGFEECENPFDVIYERYGAEHPKLVLERSYNITKRIKKYFVVMHDDLYFRTDVVTRARDGIAKDGILYVRSTSCIRNNYNVSKRDIKAAYKRMKYIVKSKNFINPKI